MDIQAERLKALAEVLNAMKGYDDGDATKDAVKRAIKLISKDCIRDCMSGEEK